MTRLQVVASFAVAIFAAAASADPALPLTPWPRSVKTSPGSLTLASGSRVVTSDKALTPLANLLADEIFITTGRRLAVAAGVPADGDIHLVLDAKLERDHHTLTVAGRAVVTGGNHTAVALGTATLLQLLRDEAGGLVLPRVAIDDGPQIPYCAVMIDIARKHHPIESLRQYIRICRFYKIRYIQLHMTDDQMWMFPSTAFPERGKRNSPLGGGGPVPPYTLKELRELVAFADARGVTLVPELELPGHSGQLRGTLPGIFHYRQNDGKLLTQETVNMVGDKAYAAIETIIGEMSDVFRSSPYFHVGFDEASIAGIEKLDEVKAFMAGHHMTAGHEVLNYFQNRVQSFVTKNGKRLSVWDANIGPVAPPKDLIVSVWNPGGGADVFVGKGYAVNQMPWSPPSPYFDPHNVNGVNLKHGDPLLHGHIYPIWESGPEQALPLLRANASVRNEPAWNPECNRGLADFLARQHATAGRLDRLLAGFTFEMKGAIDPQTYLRLDPMFEKAIDLNLVGQVKPEDVRYTLDGGEPTAQSPRWAGPLSVGTTLTLKARRFDAGAPPDTATLVIPLSKAPTIQTAARGAAVTIKPEKPGYFGPGAKGMTDGLLGVDANFTSPGWVGWNATPVEITIDQVRAVEISTLAVHCMRADFGLEFPGEVAYSASDDGKSWKPLATVRRDAGVKGLGWFRADVAPVKVRYLRAVCTPLPGAHWIFIDEFAVNPPPMAPNLKHAAMGKPVTLAHPPSETYNLPGVAGLTDGFTGPTADFLNPQWIGIEGKPFIATIDLGAATEVRRVGASFMRYQRAGIYVPVQLEVSVSDDGTSFRTIGTAKSRRENKPNLLETLAVDVTAVKARFVRVAAPTSGLWIFADEVFVNPE
jgi:hexosaminidase